LLAPLSPTLARDVTLFVAADTHYGDPFADPFNPTHIDAMNGLPGWAYPGTYGTVDAPRGVVVAGDLTDTGLQEEWDMFVANYGLTGSDGLLNYPVYEGRGNHDKRSGGGPVLNGIISRHGARTYSWDWDDVHIVCLDVKVTADICAWLADDLAAVAPHRPVILWHHYGFDLYSISDWTAEELDAYEQAIQGHYVIGIFHGHFHLSTRYTWRGYDVYSPGTPSWLLDPSFAVVRLTDDQMLVAEFRWTADPDGTWTGGSWSWSHAKPLNKPGHASLTITKVNQNDGEVTLTPPAEDPDRPQYPVDIGVSLEAVPRNGMSFVKWQIFDPNYPGDANHAIEDTNDTTAIMMDNNREVTVYFKCGSASALMPLVILGALALIVFVRRNA
jgi:hypothetical protein